MRVVEEPFVTRDAILAVLRPGEATSDHPFRTLRGHAAASPGRTVVLRVARGQVLGRLHLYSSLNADAARAYRRHDRQGAQALAARAAELELCPEADVIHRAIAGVAARMPLDPLSEDAPASLRRYVELRRRWSLESLDRARLAREWLAHSIAWTTTNWDELVEAVIELDRRAEEARSDILGETSSVSTFLGVVRRMDPTAAEIEAASGEVILLPRDELDRQGLAVLGQPVSLLREALPGGGSYVLAVPAVGLDSPASETEDVWQTGPPAPDDVQVRHLTERDSTWLKRTLAGEPTAVPAGPLSVA